MQHSAVRLAVELALALGIIVLIGVLLDYVYGLDGSDERNGSLASCCARLLQ
jgi:hypothetical protein